MGIRDRSDSMPHLCRRRICDSIAGTTLPVKSELERNRLNGDARAASFEHEGATMMIASGACNPSTLHGITGVFCTMAMHEIRGHQEQLSGSLLARIQSNLRFGLSVPGRRAWRGFSEWNAPSSYTTHLVSCGRETLSLE